MELVSFVSPSGTEELRPTHALLVAREMACAPDAAGTLPSGELAEAAMRVRERYRCRTVRKELRRVHLMADEAARAGHRVAVHCVDREVVAGMASVG